MVDHIVEHLARTGVEYIFGVDGANIEDLYDAAYFQPDITAVLAKLSSPPRRWPTATAAAASAWAWSPRRPVGER